MQHQVFLKRLLAGFLIFVCAVLLFYWVVHDDWSETRVSLSSVSRGDILTGQAGTEITQQVTPGMNALTRFQLDIHPFESGSEGNAVIRFLQADQLLNEQTLPFSSMNPDGSTVLVMDTPVALTPDADLTIRVIPDAPVLLWKGNSQNTGRIDIPVDSLGDLTMDGTLLTGNLVFAMDGVSYLRGMQYFWPVMLGIGAVLLGLALYVHHCSVTGRTSLMLRMLQTAAKYRYLLKTLVSRDFKIKYRASLLGFVWSGLHPLMMMALYYVVFSTIFRSSIHNFPVYLITGIVIYNYFGDSTTLGMQAIIGNAGLINKVYLPKYIYPLSKTISSAVNLAISLIVLLLVMLFSGAPFTKALLLFPVFLVLLILFCSGLAMCLSSWIVFFRDIQFLWSVALTAWNFFTPIFYDESILPVGWWTVFFHANPLYQFITAMRKITLDGLAPLPSSLLFCALWAVISMALGLFVFRRHQNQFVLHL